jgi:hypothetical protein
LLLLTGDRHRPDEGLRRTPVPPGPGAKSKVRPGQNTVIAEAPLVNGPPTHHWLPNVVCRLPVTALAGAMAAASISAEPAIPAATVAVIFRRYLMDYTIQQHDIHTVLWRYR